MVTYDNNDAKNGSYFKKFAEDKPTRTATISIKEENFFADNLYDEVYVNNENGEPVAQGFNYLTITVGKHLENESDYTKTYPEPEFTYNKQEGVYQATVEFIEDADYTFDVSFYDYSMNKNVSVDYGTSVAPTAFTVDNTAPVVEISYFDTDAKESPTNKGYFKGARVLIITVNEHNFNPEDLNFEKFIGKDVTFETDVETSEIEAIIAYFKDSAYWSKENDVINKASYKLVNEGTDANYAIELAYSDLADNAAKKEYLLPRIIDRLLTEKKVQVKLLETHDKWFGVTYKEDKPAVMAAIKALIEQGLYD